MLSPELKSWLTQSAETPTLATADRINAAGVLVLDRLAEAVEKASLTINVDVERGKIDAAARTARKVG